MENFVLPKGSDRLSDSREMYNNALESVRSLSSGTSFPTTNLQQGMLCYRTDENKLYQLTDVDGQIWVDEIPASISGSSASCLGNSATTTKLASSRAIDGMNFNGGGDINHYTTCSTAAATVAKTVTKSSFKLVTGSSIKIKFTVTNTASNPTLNVNSTGAKPIMYRGSAISAGYLAANRIYEFVYDGTNWELVGDVNTNTTYSAMKAATSSAAGSAGLVPAPAAGKQSSFLRGDGTWQTVGSLNTTSNITVTKSTQSAITPLWDSINQTDKGFGIASTHNVSKVVTGIAAGTYTLQNLLQQLINKSHTHTSATLTNYKTNCNCDCSCGGH